MIAYKCRCSSAFENLVSCSFLTSWLCSFSSLSCENAIYRTSGFYSLNCISCGVGIYGINLVCLIAYATISIADGSTLPLIIFFAFIFVLSYSFFTLEPKAPPSTLLFLLRTLLRKSATTFFLFSSVVYISSLVILSLVGGFYGFSFWCTNKYWKTFANTNADL